MKVDVSFFDANPVRLASRASQLAMVQAEMVCTALQPAAVTVRPVTSEGDRILDRSLVEAGGKGLFIVLGLALLAAGCGWRAVCAECV